LLSAALQRKIPAFKDPALFALARTQFALPKHGQLRHWFNGPTGVDVWSQQAIDRWLTDIRTRRDQLDRFLAGTQQ